MDQHSPRVVFHQAWSHQLPAGVRGLALARERDLCLAWDQNHWLYLLDRAGQRQGQTHFTGALTAACAADDGSAFAATGHEGEVCWFAPDFTIRWRNTLACPALATAMDPFGKYLAVSDSRGGIQMFDRLGHTVCRFDSPRPLHHLAFVPAAPVLVGCADYGLVMSFEVSGKTRWRDSPVVHAGSLSVTGDDSRTLIACFSEGLQGYDLDGRKQQRLTTSETCRLVSIAFTGKAILIAGLSKRLLLLDSTGQTLAEQIVDGPISAMALSALGEYALAAVNGVIMRWDTSSFTRV